MTEPRYQTPPTDPQARLQELQESSTISPEIAELRLAILRREIPEALVQIDAVRADDTAIAVKATIGLPGGARHSAIAAEDVDADRKWADQLEMVQAIAIARALDGLGSRSARAADVQPRRQAQSAPSSAQSPPQSSPSASPAQAQPSAEGDHLPEYSWNAFWQTMNSRNITREQVEQTVGKSVQETTPKEAVDALKAAGLL